MILCYHKVSATNKTHWWVTADEFDRHLADLQAYDVVTLDDYDATNPRHAVITFDGIYSDVARYALPLLRKWGYPFEMFVIGDHIGRDNGFDQHVEPPAMFASLEDLDRLVAAGGRVQWHTRTHGALAGLIPERLDAELTPPPELRDRYPEPHLRWFAYPHGRDAQDLREPVASRFAGALAMVDGGDHSDRYSLPRIEVTQGFSASRSTVSVIVVNHNYGRYLPEALDSVFRQSGRIDEVLVIDDASTDGSHEVLARYEDRVRMVRNERNLGIVENFKKAVSLTQGDYVVLLGADNRMRSDFVERCKAALDAEPTAAVAYTDMVIFGPRAKLLARQTEAVPTAADDVFLRRFPAPTPERLARLHESNIIHGSSMYRREDYLRAGGYRSSERPEDHDLFVRMLAAGDRTAVHVAEPVLEYRQHSTEQANTTLSAQLEAAHHRRQARHAAEQAEHWHEAAQRLSAEEQARAVRLGEVHEMLVAANDELVVLRPELERLRRDNAELHESARRLADIENGGWWRLRSRLLPVLRVAARARRALRRR